MNKSRTALTRVLATVLLGLVTLTIPAAFIFAALAMWWLGELMLFGPEAVEKYANVEPTLVWIVAALAVIIWPYFHVKLYKRLELYYTPSPPYVWLQESEVSVTEGAGKGVEIPSTGYPSYPDNWQELRQIVLERDGYRCVNCGDSIHDATLQVHHIVPLIKGGSNNLGNLATLCKPCHKKLHPHLR